MRAVCAIIDAFHFLPPAEAAAAADPADAAAPALAGTRPSAGAVAASTAAAAIAANVDDADEVSEDEAVAQVAADSGGSGKQEAAAAAAQAADIRAALLKRVLPALSAQLVAKGDVSLNPDSTSPLNLFVIEIQYGHPRGTDERVRVRAAY